jgi:hypothetical protein
MRSGSLRGCRLFAGLVAPLALYGAAAVAQSTPAAGKQGAIIRFEESKGSSILYLEESGGLSAKAAPLPVKRGEAAPAKAARAAKPVVVRNNTPEADPTRISTRRGSLPDAVAARQ